MRLHPIHKGRQFDDTVSSIDGLSSGAITVTAVAGSSPTGGLAFDTSATNRVTDAGVPLATIVSTSSPVLPTTASSTVSPSGAADSASASTKGGQIPVGTVIAACVGAFVGLFLLICGFVAWYKRSSDKLSTSERRNVAGHAEQQRAYVKSFKPLDDSEKPRDDLPPQLPDATDQQDLEENHFSMFKKSPSIRTAYTTKTTTDEFDLPQLEFTKYHPTLAQELSLENPQRPFATAAAAVAARQNSGVSWDGETLGDDSFLSMHSVRVESGTMSPTMVMAKMTPPATASALHKWESAEVLNADGDEASPIGSRNPFAEMAEERKARSNNPFFNAQDINRASRVVRSRSNSRTSRTSRAQSIVRSESRGPVPVNTNPFLDLHEAVPISSVEATATPESLMPNAGLPTTPGVASGASAQAFGNDHAMASLIAALHLTEEQVAQRLRVVSMQGSTYSAYSETDDDALTVREFPLPPGTNAPNAP